MNAKHLSRLLALLLCLAMLTGVLAGCGSSSADTDEDTATETTDETEEAESEEAEEAEETEETEITFPGADSAELSFSNEYSLPLSEDGATITWMRSGVNLMGTLQEVLAYETFQEFPYIQEWQEITGVTLEFTELEYTTMAETMSLYIAAGDYTDLMTDVTYTGGLTGALEDEVIIDLTDYLEDYAPNYYYMINSNEDQTSIFTLDGKVLAFMAPYESFTNNQGLVIRSDWLEEQGLEVPTTYDEMYDVLLTLKDAYDLDTAIYMNQQCTITGLTVGYDVASYVTDGSAEDLPFYVDNGEVKCSLIEDGFKEYLMEMNEWYEAGLFDSDFMSIEYDPFSSYLDGQITSDEMAVWCTSGEGIDNYTVPVTCVPSLTVEEGGTDHVTSMSLTVDSEYDTVVSTNCEDIELAMNLLDYFYSVDGIVFSNYGIEGETYTLVDGVPTFTELVTDNEYDLTVANYMRGSCAYGVFPSVMLRYRTAEFNSELVQEAWEVWSSNIDGSMALPDNVSLTADESEESSYYATDIQTYAVQMVPQFILGVVSFDEWDSYVQDLLDMGLQTCIDLEQDAYDRAVGAD